VEATVSGKSSGADTITFEDAAATTLQNLDITGQTTGELYVLKNTAVTLQYAVLDQFGTLFTAANHSVEVTDGTVTATGVFSGGRATVNFAGWASAGAKTLLGDMFKSGAAVGTDWDIELTVLATAAKAPSTVTITATDGLGTAASPKALRLKSWNDADTRIGEDAPAGFTVGGTGALTTKAALTDVNGNATQGPITYSGAGLLFLDADAQVWSAGSITVQSSTTGEANVEIFSNTAGAHVLTVTSGSASATKTFRFETAKDDTGAAITASAPATAKAGSSFKVTVALKDKYGNAVVTDANATGFLNGTTDPTFSIAWDGPGIVAGTMPTATNSSGEASFYVLLGVNDTGAGTVTATYDADGTGTASAAISVTATVNAPSAVADTKVNAGSFKGFVAVYAKGYEGKRLSAKIGNDWVIVPALASNFERVTDFTGAGVNISVRVFIDRVLVGTFPLVTK
jgi:trimeric autotransporter adhesin